LFLFPAPYLALESRHFEAAAGPGQAQKTAFIPRCLQIFKV